MPQKQNAQQNKKIISKNKNKQNTHRKDHPLKNVWKRAMPTRPETAPTIVVYVM